MSGGLESLRGEVAAAWIRSGDPEVLARAVRWPDVPVEVLGDAAAAALDPDVPEEKSILLARDVATALASRPGDASAVQEQLERLREQLLVRRTEGYEADAALEAIEVALESASSATRDQEGPLRDSGLDRGGASSGRVRLMGGRADAPVVSSEKVLFPKQG